MATIERAVLLAAGKGTRLLPRTAHVPKCMVEVAGRPIVDHLLKGLARVGVRDLLVVTGYKEAALREHLGGEAAGIRCTYVDSPEFASTNNIVSLDRARPHIIAPFYLLESDVWADPQVLERLAQPDRLAVADYTDVMDGTGVVVDENGHVVEMRLAAHKGPRPIGLKKTVNFYSISAELWAGFREGVASYIAAGHTDAYYEAVLADLLKSGRVRMVAADVTDLPWVEIDNLEDLARAEELVNSR